MGNHHPLTLAGSKQAQRLLAVLALLQGQPAAAVCQQYRMCRSDLYK